MTQKLETMINAVDPGLICSKHKAITALFPYIVQQEQDGKHMFDIFLHAVKASKQMNFMWGHIEGPLVTMLLDEGSSVSLKQAIILASLHLPWWTSTKDRGLIQLWAARASAVPYTDEIGQVVADTLLQIASNPSLQLEIPVHMWSWLNKCPSPPPVSAGRYCGTSRSVVQIVRKLGDIETLTSYLVFVWSEWDYLYKGGFDEMCTSIREDFSGIRMGYHRKKLLQHLDHVLGQLDLGLVYFQQQRPLISEYGIQKRETQYGQLKEVLMEVDKEAIDDLICKSPINTTHPSYTNSH